MSLAPFSDSVSVARREIELLGSSWGWLLALGVLLIVLGTIAISFPWIATGATILTLGVLLLFGAGVEIASAIWARCWPGFFLQLLTGLLYLVVGLLLIEQPDAAAAGLTLLIAASLMVGGLFRIVVAFTQKFHQWGWVVVSGLISLVLGVCIWRKWPGDTAWVIGLFLGVDLLFAGWTWVMLALAARSMPKSVPS